MADGAGELLGYKRTQFYDKEEATALCTAFNARHASDDQFSPMMVSLGEQNGLAEYLQYAESAGFIIVFVFAITMSAVLWNAALMSGIRRYGEVGVRLAIGENKTHIYQSLIGESLLLGITGAFLGTALGLLASYYFQEKGLDMSAAFRNSSMMITNVVRARVTGTSFYIGFVPGILATVLGTAFAGIQIYKRQTASLFKELEA
jgi:putative ABC transport system permease protein